MPAQVDKAHDAAGICKVFADKYSTLYSSVGYTNSEMDSCMAQVNDLVRSSCMQGSCNHHCSVTVDDVTKGLDHVKLGKSDE